jgi:hypothetical protein
MRFSTVAILAVLAPSASGFVVPSNRPNVGVAYRTGAPLSMAIEDLEAKLLNPEESKKKAKQERPKPAPKPAPEKKAPEPKKSRKEIQAEAKAQAEELKRLAESEKAAAERKVEKKVREVKKEVKSAKYTLSTDVDKPKPARIEKDSPLPKAPSVNIKAPSVKLPSRPKPAPKPKSVAKPSAPADANAGPVGVALGAAPLIAIPLVGLTAARGALSKTAARRAQIQKEMAAAEEARKKKSISADVDSGSLAKATVRSMTADCCFT